MNLNENLIFNKEDLEFNVDKFESGESNVLLVTGFSGSGKTTLAAKLAKKYNCTHYEIDCLTFYLFGDMTREDALGDEDGLVAFIDLKNLPQYEDYDSLPEDQIEELIREYIKFLIEWCKNKKGQKFIIEGLQIYNVYQDGDTHITSCPMIIKGTSGLISTIRAAKRNDGPFTKWFGPLLKFILKDNKDINRLEKEMNKKTFADEFREYDELWN
jgi:tRNA A37 threonylcarbamoyladenosine biosynthesis protein TsaE